METVFRLRKWQRHVTIQPMRRTAQLGMVAVAMLRISDHPEQELVVYMLPSVSLLDRLAAAEAGSVLPEEAVDQSPD